MKKWTKLLIPVAAVLALVAWYVFRPERLVVNRRVDEAMPTGQGGLLSLWSRAQRSVEQPSRIDTSA
jgi:hypothetical protein